MERFYHVTTRGNAVKILRAGILPDMPQIWHKQNGRRFPKGHIYVLTDFLDAVRWAFKMDWGINEAHRLDPKKPAEPIVIIAFRNDGRLWEPDNHIEKIGYRGRWLKSSFLVLPEDILLLVNESAWRLEVPKLTAKEYFTRTDAVITL